MRLSTFSALRRDLEHFVHIHVHVLDQSNGDMNMYKFTYFLHVNFHPLDRNKDDMYSVVAAEEAIKTLKEGVYI
jgi:hypothetical protein